MHIVLQDQNDTLKKSTLCLERNCGHAEIIASDPTQVQHLVSIAHASGANAVYVIVPAEKLQTWLDAGFQQVDMKVVVHVTETSKGNIR